MADWTNQKPFLVTEEHCKAAWLGGKNGKYFRCCLCGHRFVPGDVARWVFTNNIPGASGNPMVCVSCDGLDIIERWKQMHIDAREKFWWFNRAYKAKV